jgi:hypothetical protein
LTCGALIEFAQIETIVESLADKLPPEVAKAIHPAWRANEAEYWKARESLLANFGGQWIAFANGTVLVSGKSPVEVLHAGQATGEHPYVTCVGRELEPTRMRRCTFSYDATYPEEALPIMAVEIRVREGEPGVKLDRVIPDTGADASALPWADCKNLELDPMDGVPGLIGGVGNSTAPTLLFSAWAYLDGREYQCRLQADFEGDERILGRDVLNQLELLFRGPAREVIVNPR